MYLTSGIDGGVQMRKGKNVREDDIPIDVGNNQCIRWYCPNCSNLITIYAEKSKEIETSCSRCGIHMIRKHISRRMIDFIAGAMFGGTVGVLAMCFCIAASRADKE